ncbi:hypothetical protein D9756_005166 [Leucocoprinus leucothites]|uniref:Uncharacterized protein n=1 Tax=Leucocoprinus leucothites TaxID=201217 RepID=A0A8H5G9U0_9AGAR|nr:hypothetical protein D9756_005166 [Leucoagaricus leucothites]
MAIVKSSTAHSKLDPPEPVIEPQPRFRQPTIWWKGPDEHIREDQHASRVHEHLLPHLEFGTKLKQPPPGHIRLLFWWSLDELKVPKPNAHMSIDIALDPDGSLDLLKIQKIWGLETVQIIHPLRWRIFQPGDPNRLSALGVHDLSLERHIFITENPVTRDTTVKRILRLLCIDLYFLSFLGLYHLIFHGGFTPKQRLPVPEWYDDTVAFRNNVVHQLRDIKREMDDTREWMLSCGNRFFGLGAHRRTRYSWTNTPVGDAFQDLGGRRRELAMQWAPAVLTVALIGLVWFLDHFVIRVF